MTDAEDEYCDNCGHEISEHNSYGCAFNGSNASCRCGFGGGSR